MAFEMALSVDDLAVRRAGRLVAAGASFSAEPGAALMLRGGNGTGKTSILRAVAGLARYDGDVRFTRGVQTLDPGFIRSHQIHYVGMEGGLNPRMTVEETARFLAAFYGAEAGEALADLGLSSLGERQVGQLSTGQKRRLGLVKLLILPRALWLLDEPFAGLDESGARIVGTLVEGHRARGGVVLCALHDAADLRDAATLRLEAA
jgi:heme exporter protein A